MPSDTFNAGGSWTCPTGVVKVQAECWGQGATGQDATELSTGGDGGGGGGYSRYNSIDTTPGGAYSAQIDGADGSLFIQDSPFSFLAQALAADNGRNGASAYDGSASAGPPDVAYAGGNGGDPSAAAGGGGGSSAGTGAAGGNGANANGAFAGAGGTAPAGGGNGGTGGQGGAGAAGTSPGGGGGGGAIGFAGGAGGAGRVKITYYGQPTPTAPSNGATAQSRSSITATFTGGAAAGGHTIYVGRTSDPFSSPDYTVASAVAGGTELVQGTLSAGTTYYWGVRSVSASPPGPATNSSVFSFATEGTASVGGGRPTANRAASSRPSASRASSRRAAGQ